MCRLGCGGSSAPHSSSHQTFPSRELAKFSRGFVSPLEQHLASREIPWGTALSTTDTTLVGAADHGFNNGNTNTTLVGAADHGFNNGNTDTTLVGAADHGFNSGKLQFVVLAEMIVTRSKSELLQSLLLCRPLCTQLLLS